jgi:hypothetical protein
MLLFTALQMQQLAGLGHDRLPTNAAAAAAAAH